MVFFQVALLGGYLYAHLSVRWLGVRRQAMVHLIVLALPILALPLALPDTPAPVGAGQSPWIIGLLAAAVGAPFFVLAAASPLLQRWLASTRHEAAGDPYFLYAGSNAGSLAGLLAYPFLLEPLLPLSDQSRFWSLAYGAFVVLVLLCAAVVIRSSGLPGSRDHAEAPPADPSERPSSRDRLFWIAAAAVPSSLLLGVTQYLTSQIAPVPLLWVLPLALYLITFIVAFGRREVVSPATVSRLLAIICVAMLLALLARIVDPTWAVILLHLGVLTASGLLCHLRLAERRPSTAYLTEYYLLISTGGAIGGIFSALVAPLVFDFIAEYPIALGLACLFRLPMPAGREGVVGRILYSGRVLDLALPAGLAIYLMAMASRNDVLDSLPGGVVMLLLVLLPVIISFLFSPRPVRFGLAIAVLMTFGQSGRMYRGDVLHTERTFFGVYTVARDQADGANILFHGSTAHGVQSTDPALAAEPLAYYHRTGPAGGIVAAIAGDLEKRTVALVGAGTGALAVLAGPHQRVTLFEIDPAVVSIAMDPRYFSYLQNTRATYETVVGDGRLALSRSSSTYDLMVLDAFSSGTIPVHLLTREAVVLYLDRLEPGGVLLFHISNRHLDLGPVLAGHARDLGLTAFENIDVRGEDEPGVFSSRWVLLVRDPADRAGLPSIGWTPLIGAADAQAWTDDFSNLLSVQRWN